MKMRILFSILFFSAIALTGGSLQAQAVQKGNVMLDVYYGFPNLTTGVLRAVAKNVTNDPDLKVTGMGHLARRPPT